MEKTAASSKDYSLTDINLIAPGRLPGYGINQPAGRPGVMDIPQNVTNPKTIRKWERMQKESNELEQFAKEKNCTVFKRGTNNWGFKRNGDESPYGFDTQGEVYIFIKKHNANTGIV